MTDIELLKSQWNSLRIEYATLQQKNIELTRRLATTRVVSKQQRLARSYRIGYMGFAFPLLAWMLYAVVHASAAISIVYAVYGLVLAWGDIWFMRFIRKADYTSMPTVEALSHASKIVRYQNIGTVLSILSCIALCIPLFYEMSLLGEDLVVGGIIGGCIGGTFGTVKCVRNHMIARKMLSEIREIETTERQN